MYNLSWLSFFGAFAELPKAVFVFKTPQGGKLEYGTACVHGCRLYKCRECDKLSEFHCLLIDS